MDLRGRQTVFIAPMQSWNIGSCDSCTARFPPAMQIAAHSPAKEWTKAGGSDFATQPEARIMIDRSRHNTMSGQTTL